jgi:predicted transposase YbfD/YdcC
MNLRENYFIKLMKYIKNVYHIDEQIERVTDSRLNPTYKTPQIISLVLTGFLLRIQSFNQLNFMIKAGEFNNMHSRDDNLPKIDAIRNSLKSIDLDALCQINKRIIRKAIRNRALSTGTIDGKTVAAIDGTNLFNTRKPSCDDCIRRNGYGKVYYAHSCTVMSLIGESTNLVIDYEKRKHRKEANDTGEGELISAKRLLNKAVSAHKGLIDVVTYDALACNSVFINECINLNVDAVIRVKGNYNLAVEEVKRATNTKQSVGSWQDGEYKITAYESDFTMDGVNTPLRYVKFAKIKSNGDRSQVLIVTTALDMNLKTVYRIMKARWNIENCVFNNLKNHANLNHSFVHGGNATDAILYLMFIASNLFQLFKMRRLKNHVPIQIELIRILLKGLYQLDRKAIPFFNTA